ncbi:MAG: DinB family protein [Bacteroidetes bacterium]|nr:MAG: DinB family protein [Bacteroidota bacterium]TAG87138.1 MAG: DinB family protein [Bacteroidota bacterium]
MLTTQNIGELPEYSKGYVDLLPKNDSLFTIFEKQSNNAYDFYAQIPEDKLLYRYAEGKWTIKEILLHIIDVERILAYRSLRFARTDNNELPGFDQDKYVLHSKANERNWEELQQEFKIVRQSTILLFKNFDKEMLLESGLANNYRFSVNAMGFMIAGHELHHRIIIQERYL